MIKEMLKTAGVDNMDDFYKLHPTEEHFFKTYPHMKDKVKKGKKIRRPKAAMGGYYQQGGGVDPMQIIQAYAQAAGVDPKQIIAQLKQMAPEEQQAALQQMMQQLQGGGQQGQYAQGGSLPKEVLRSRLESHMSPSEAQEYLDEYAKGGIHINPAKKGTFTAQATRMGMSVKEAARHILAHKDRYSPGMVKKANFARNAANWKHEYGGYTRMYQEGGETMGQEQMEAPQQQMQEQSMGQEQQQPQGQVMGQDPRQMVEQLAQMVIQALQQGMQPEEIIQMLVQQGIPEEVATEVVQMVMQHAQSASAQGGPGQQYQPQGEQYQGPQSMQPQQEQPQAAYGGYYADGGMTGGMFFNQSYMPFDY